MSIDDGWDSPPRLRERLMQVAEERDQLQAQLRAEREGALAREQALEEAIGLIQRIIVTLGDEFWSLGGDPDAREKRYAWYTETCQWLTRRRGVAKEERTVCCRPDCRAAASETGADGVTRYCRQHWQEATSEGMP